MQSLPDDPPRVRGGAVIFSFEFVRVPGLSPGCRGVGVQVHVVPSKLEIISVRWVVRYAHGMKGDRCRIIAPPPSLPGGGRRQLPHPKPMTCPPPHFPLRHLPPCAEPHLLVVGCERGGHHFKEAGLRVRDRGQLVFGGFECGGRLREGVRGERRPLRSASLVNQT
jgi:hypothetical protein